MISNNKTRLKKLFLVTSTIVILYILIDVIMLKKQLNCIIKRPVSQYKGYITLWHKYNPLYKIHVICDNNDIVRVIKIRSDILLYSSEIAIYDTSNDSTFNWAEATIVPFTSHFTENKYAVFIFDSEMTRNSFPAIFRNCGNRLYLFEHSRYYLIELSIIHDTDNINILYTK